MFKRSVLAAGVGALAAFAAAGASLADYTVCNRSHQRIDVAFGYPHPEFGWTAEGWWNLQPGECKVVFRGNLTNRYYYVYATGSSGGVWQGSESQRGGLFCIEQNRFVLANNNFLTNGLLDCASRHLQIKKFILVDTQGAANHIHNLTD